MQDVQPSGVRGAGGDRSKGTCVQGVGGAGVDKRIDVIATAIRGGIAASELADLELAYAPQFGSAKDPINMLGYIAENLATGLAETVQWYEVADEVARGAQLIDVRTAAEYARGTVEGAINIPVDELRDRRARRCALPTWNLTCCGAASPAPANAST